MAKRGSLAKFAKKEVIERPTRIRRYKYLFLIVCEDEKTEPAYFSEYITQIPEDTIYLKPVGTGRDPQGVVNRAVDERNMLALEAKREVDEVWVVFDKDDADENVTKTNNFKNAFQIAADEKFEVAYSNEVFELWFLLHFVDVKEDVSLPRAEIYSKLKEIFKTITGYEDYEYDHKVIDTRTVEIVFKAGDRNSAIDRAKRLLEFQKETEPIEANPSTKVHLLIQNLMEWIEFYSYDPKN